GSISYGEVPDLTGLFDEPGASGAAVNSVSGSISYGEVPDLTGLFDEPGASGAAVNSVSGSISYGEVPDISDLFDEPGATGAADDASGDSIDIAGLFEESVQFDIESWLGDFDPDAYFGTFDDVILSGPGEVSIVVMDSLGELWGGFTVFENGFRTGILSSDEAPAIQKEAPYGERRYELEIPYSFDFVDVSVMKFSEAGAEGINVLNTPASEMTASISVSASADANTNVGPDADANANTDAGASVDFNTNGGAGANESTSSGANIDAGADANTNVGSDANANANTNTNVGPDADANANTDAGAFADDEIGDRNIAIVNISDEYPIWEIIFTVRQNGKVRFSYYNVSPNNRFYWMPSRRTSAILGADSGEIAALVPEIAPAVQATPATPASPETVQATVAFPATAADISTPTSPIDPGITHADSPNTSTQADLPNTPTQADSPNTSTPADSPNTPTQADSPNTPTPADSPYTEYFLNTFSGAMVTLAVVVDILPLKAVRSIRLVCDGLSEDGEPGETRTWAFRSEDDEYSMPDWTFTTGMKRFTSPSMEMGEGEWAGTFYFIVSLDYAFEGAAFRLSKVELEMEDGGVIAFENPENAAVVLQIFPLPDLL
ncbi:MAG: hypothetical protein FWH55_00255, partial [Oscillospiraceae bacterium]|nr:hypothetical protein [Oscillospiraceae bacterium]